MIPLFKVKMSDVAPQKANEVLTSGYIGQGAVVEQFEDELQRVLQSPSRPISLNSCTSAITLALHLLDVGPGDEVITTPITCTATNSPIVTLGARPVWADVDVNGNISVADVRRKITPRTKAIIAVDWSGRSCDYIGLKSFDLPVIQDAAHGPLVNWDNAGHFVCLSFQAIKHMTTVDGGALIIAPDYYKARKAENSARLLRWYGLDRTSSTDFRCSQNITRPGFKFHMNDVNAAIGLANLSDLVATVEAHRANARFYNNRLWPITPNVKLPAYTYIGNWWTYHLLVTNRDAFSDFMRSRGIATSQVHARNDKHTGFFYPNGPLPGVEYFDSHQVAIPVGWWLTENDREYIAQCVEEFARKDFVSGQQDSLRSV